MVGDFSIIGDVEDYSLESWKPTLFGYDVSNLGRVRNSKTKKVLTTRKTHGSMIAYMKQNGKLVSRSVGKMVYEAFVGKIPDGYVIYHRNRVPEDCSLINLEVCKNNEFQKRYGKKRAKTIVMVNKDGEIVDIFSDAYECAKKLFYSDKTIRRRCNGLFENSIGDFDIAWESDKRSMKKAYNRLGVPKEKRLYENC